MGFGDILIPKGNKIGGVCNGTEILYAFADQIATHPQLPARAGDYDPDDPASSLTDYTELTGDFVFKDPVTQGFCKLQIKPKTGEILGEAQGDEGSKSMKNSFDFVITGDSDEISTSVARFLNEGVIFIITEPDGSKRVMGDSCYPAQVETLTWTHKKNPAEGTKEQVYRVTYTDIGKTPKLTGAAPLKP